MALPFASGADVNVSVPSEATLGAVVKRVGLVFASTT